MCLLHTIEYKILEFLRLHLEYMINLIIIKKLYDLLLKVSCNMLAVSLIGYTVININVHLPNTVHVFKYQHL